MAKNVLSFDDKESIQGAFHEQLSEFNYQPKSFNSLVKKMNDEVMILDRLDDFTSTKIAAETYEKRDPESKYGILRDKEIHRTSEHVILDHQIKAAKRFLSEKRGFGLLADVVGSGKTFEACLVISELAARGKIRSMLLVVPKQMVEDWVRTLEYQFGMGEGSLLRVYDNYNPASDGGFTRINDFAVPNKPIIVAYEDFIKWPEDNLKMLFDIVVVDEAHHLCEVSDEDGRYSSGMFRLSKMMEVKRAADKSYCLLLTATPHSGNLRSMLRLWYFVKCKGGTPKDFTNIPDSEKSDRYNKTKKEFETIVCEGCTTVMELVNRMKRKRVETRYLDELKAYYKKQGKPFDYNTRSEALKNELIDDFLDSSDDSGIKDDIAKYVGSKYHNGILRPIMVRQPNPLPKKKSSVNYYFYPTGKIIDSNTTAKITTAAGQFDISLGFLGKRMEAYDYDSECVRQGDKTLKLREILKTNRNNEVDRGFYNTRSFLEMVNGITSFDDNDFVKKAGSFRYYVSRFNETVDFSNKNASFIIPVNDKEAVKAGKLETLKSILKENSDKRIIVFVDYSKKEQEVNEVCESIRQMILDDETTRDRLLLGKDFAVDSDEKKEVVDNFNAKDNAVLLVSSAAFTEGLNLQSCSIVVNYEMPANPLAVDQRVGRVFRLGQKTDVTIFSLADMTELEGYVLAYYTAIGLMVSNTGDATIIAGSNNDNMVALKCPKCGNVMLKQKADYDEEIKEKGALYCSSCASSNDFKENYKLIEIQTNDFVCGKCKSRCSSTADGHFTCAAVSDELMSKGTYEASQVEGMTVMKCKLSCVLLHCKNFNYNVSSKNCALLKALKENPKLREEPRDICVNCKHNQECNAEMPTCFKAIKHGDNSYCLNSCQYAKSGYDFSCIPGPHKIRFNKDMTEGECPVCAKNRKHGKLRIANSRTFETFVTSLWNIKYKSKGTNGKEPYFCASLNKEAMKVAIIKNMLAQDQEETFE